MSLVEELDKAIAAHGMWKARLRTAIDSGTLDLPVETIRANDQCAFGKWLCGSTISPADRSSAHYKTVHRLHSNFHQAAARVADLARQGKKKEAEELMGLGGDFNEASASLVMSIMAWKKSIQ
jgi:methyl-accepting chemotaxis protein